MERVQRTWREDSDGLNLNQNCFFHDVYESISRVADTWLCSYQQYYILTVTMGSCILSIIFPRMQCARSVRVRKSRPVSQFCHTLFNTDILSYIEVTLTFIHRKPNPLFICFYLSCIVCCAAVQTFQMKTCHIDAEELGIVEGSCSTCAQWQPPTPLAPSSVVTAAFVCMVMLMAYCWLSLLSIHSPFYLLLSLLWKD